VTAGFFESQVPTSAIWEDGALAAVSPLGWANLVTQNDPKPFTLPRHLRYLDYHLRQLAAGSIDTLLIQMPVQHAKSTSCTVWFPAWYLCKNPEKTVGVVSYNQEFAEDRFGKVARDIVERAGMGWFGVGVDSTSSAKGRWNIAGHNGQFLAVGIDKGLTGRGADLLIVDDPINTLEQALSVKYNQFIWEKWQYEIATRLSPRAPKIFIMSRWAQFDFMGRLITDLNERGAPYTLIDLPALALDNDPLGRAPGEPLWPEVRDLGFLTEQRDRIGPRAFDALFQGRPRADAGALFQPQWFRYYDLQNDKLTLLDRANNVIATYGLYAQCTIFQMIDLATSTSASADYTVIGTFAVTPRNEIAVLDIVRVRVPGPQQLALAQQACHQWRSTRVGIESVGYQLAFVQAAIQAGLPAVELKRARGESKETRAYVAASRYEGLSVFHPLPRLGKKWLPDFEDELLHFPTGLHDDQVDVVSDAAKVVVDRSNASSAYGVMVS